MRSLKTSTAIPVATMTIVSLLFVYVPIQSEAARRPGEVRKRGAAKVALIEFGRRLFFDPVVSRTGERSCASCHDPRHGFSDASRFSEDDVGETVRHSQTLINVKHSPTVHWDGEFESIELLVASRIGLPGGAVNRYGGTQAPLSAGHSALGLPEQENMTDAQKATALSRLTAKLARLPRAQDVLERAARYREAVRAAYGDTRITRARISQALGAYCRSITSGSAPFDRRTVARETGWTAAAARGFALFQGRAGCVKCHVLSSKTVPSKRPIFTDFGFRNTGIAWLDASSKITDKSPIRRRSEKAKERHRLAAESVAPTASARPGFHDPGRKRISTRRADVRSFKTPTLRDVATRAPYMHNGMFPTLRDVVKYYARGGSADPEKDRRLKPFVVSEQDVSDLVAFLESLTSDERPGLAHKPYAHRRKETTLRFIDAKGGPLNDVDVTLVAVGDDLPAESGPNRAKTRTLTTNAHGRITYAPSRTTHVRMGLDAVYPPPTAGPLVPDTCRSATVTIPVDGWVQLDLNIHDNAFAAPDRLRALHTETELLPGHEEPCTTFVRVRTAKAGDITVARYRARYRNDVPPVVEIQIPGLTKVLPVQLNNDKPISVDSRATALPTPRVSIIR